MIGDKDLNIDRDSNSTPWLLDMLATAAKNTGHAAFVFKNSEADGRPSSVPAARSSSARRGRPRLRPPHRRTSDGYHHTAQDTLDKVSATPCRSPAISSSR